MTLWQYLLSFFSLKTFYLSVIKLLLFARRYGILTTSWKIRTQGYSNAVAYLHRLCLEL